MSRWQDIKFVAWATLVGCVMIIVIASIYFGAYIIYAPFAIVNRIRRRDDQFHGQATIW